jgi:hypothetical protein
MATHLTPSGDTTGIADHKAIMAGLRNGQCVRLDTGLYHVCDTIVVSSFDNPYNRLVSLEGSGQGTIIRATSSEFPVIKGIANPAKPIGLNSRVANLEINGGFHGLELSLGSYVHCHHVTFRKSASHGVYVHDGGWIFSFIDCDFAECGGDGINSVSTLKDQNGNHVALSACRFAGCVGHGIHWGAAQLNLAGCLFECNQQSGVAISCAERSAAAIEIGGCYFENNGEAGIELLGTTGFAVVGIDIHGNYIYQTNAAPCIKASGDANTVRNGVIAKSNVFSSTGPLDVDLGAAGYYWDIHASGPASRYKFLRERNNFYSELSGAGACRCPIDASAGDA